jgi:hypothetical protein
VIQAVAESGTPLKAAEANMLFERLKPHAQGASFEAAGTKLAESESSGRIALGLRVLGKIRSPSAGAFIIRYLAKSLAGIPQKQEYGGISAAMSPPDGEDEQLRLAAISATAPAGS